MEINYWWIAPIAIAVIVMIVWVLKRDQKDKDDFVQDIIESELHAEKHDGERDKEVKP
ncbi:hypothetical protein GCM10027049_27010 [Mucilaginibacter puniceus]